MGKGVGRGNAAGVVEPAAGGGIAIYLCRDPVDFRAYAERTVMQSPRRDVLPAAVFRCSHSA